MSQSIAKFVRNKAAQKAPEVDAQIKQGRKHGGCLSIDAAVLCRMVAGQMPFVDFRVQ